MACPLISQSEGGRREAQVRRSSYFRLPPSAFRLLHHRYLVFQQTYDPDWLAFFYPAATSLHPRRRQK